MSTSSKRSPQEIVSRLDRLICGPDKHGTDLLKGGTWLQEIGEFVDWLVEDSTWRAEIEKRVNTVYELLRTPECYSELGIEAPESPLLEDVAYRLSDAFYSQRSHRAEPGWRLDFWREEGEPEVGRKPRRRTIHRDGDKTRHLCDRDGGAHERLVNAAYKQLCRSRELCDRIRRLEVEVEGEHFRKIFLAYHAVLPDAAKSLWHPLRYVTRVDPEDNNKPFETDENGPPLRYQWLQTGSGPIIEGLTDELSDELKKSLKVLKDWATAYEGRRTEKETAGGNSEHEAKNESPLDPLAEGPRLVYDKLRDLAEHKAMTGPQILNWLAEKHKRYIDEKTLRNTYLDPLKPYGLRNKAKVGYFIRPNK